MIDVRFRQIWFNAVLACGELPAPVRLVAQAIGHAVNIGTGQCNPSYETLGQRTACSPRSCMRAVKALEDAGWITVVRTKGRHSNSFVLKMPVGAAVNVEIAREVIDQTEAHDVSAVTVREMNRDTALSPFAAAQPCQNSVTVPLSEPCQGSVTDANGQQCQIAPSTVTELCHPNKENKYSPLTPQAQTDTDIDAAFEELWEVWGNVLDKGKARNAFHRAVNALRVDPSTIIDAARERRLRRLAGHAVEAEPLARWLRKEGWSGEPPSAPSRDPKSAQTAKASVFVEEGSAAWRAWQAHRRREGKGLVARSFPSRPGRLGWYFETEWPATSREVHHG